MNENRKEGYGFWETAIIGTLMIVFFPWSLLFCVLFLGLEDTKVLILTLIRDALKIAVVIVPILLFVIVVLVLVS